MKLKFLYRILLAAMCCCTLGVACNDDDPMPEPMETPEPIGTYEFDGDTYDILTGYFVEDDFDYVFTFSPLAPSAPLTTYAVFSIHKFWEGEEVDVETVYHNDDYVFIYEDPVHYYSQYWKLQSGTYFVKRNRGNNFSIRLDFRLADGTPFKIDFTGELTAPETEE